MARTVTCTPRAAQRRKFCHMHCSRALESRSLFTCWIVLHNSIAGTVCSARLLQALCIGIAGTVCPARLLQALCIDIAGTVCQQLRSA
jgi:hypothetical protein